MTLSPDLFEPLTFVLFNDEGEQVNRIVSTLVGWTWERGEWGAGDYFDTPEEAAKAYELKQFNKPKESGQLDLFS